MSERMTRRGAYTNQHIHRPEDNGRNSSSGNEENTNIGSQIQANSKQQGNGTNKRGTTSGNRKGSGSNKNKNRRNWNNSMEYSNTTIDPKSHSCQYNDTRNNNENEKANIDVKVNVDHIKRMITTFIRGNVFPGLKFVSTNFLVPLLISTELENPNFSFREGIEDEEFENFYKGKVSTAFTELRHASQQHSKRTYIGK